MTLFLKIGAKSERAAVLWSERSMNRSHSGRRSAGKTYLTRERRSTAAMERKRRQVGARREKSLLAKTTSFEARTVSIQPPLAEVEGGDEEGGGDDVASWKPKSLQMREGKVREKKWREWSGERERRKESTASQAEEIWCGAEEERMVLARSWDLERESTVYECGSIVR